MKDPRLSSKSLHKLEDIVFISVAYALWAASPGITWNCLGNKSMIGYPVT